MAKSSIDALIRAQAKAERRLRFGQRPQESDGQAHAQAGAGTEQPQPRPVTIDDLLRGITSGRR